MKKNKRYLSEEYMIEEGLDELQLEQKKIRIGNRVNDIDEKIEYYIKDSFLYVKKILFENSQNTLSNENISQLFELADSYKNNGKYEKSNDIFGILLDFFIHNTDSGIKIAYETRNCDYETYDNSYNYYYDLALLTFEGQYLNIPLPLLSKEAIKIFFTEGTSILYKKEHSREISQNKKITIELDKKYNDINPNKASWLLESDDMPSSITYLID